jgi:hypothetical protein
MAIYKKSTLLGESYTDLPKDPKDLLKKSKMANSPEVTLEDFLETRPDQIYEKYAISTGADTTTEYKAKPLHRIKVIPEEYEQFMKDNMKHCEKKYYEKTYQKGVNELTLNLPLRCGYNHRNTCEYNWGEYGDTQKKLKYIIGGKETIEDELGFDYETSSVRLLAYLPGQILPWHFDNMGNWFKKNKNLNPDIDTMTCDMGDIKRYFIAITDWHWGHFLQIANSYFPKWKSGEVYEIPKGVYHLSANIGIRLKVTASITGVVKKNIGTHPMVPYLR